MESCLCSTLQVTNHVDGDLHLTSRGVGLGHAHIHLKYHSKQSDNVNSCKFDLSVTASEHRLSWEDLLGNPGRRRRSARVRYSLILSCKSLTLNLFIFVDIYQVEFPREVS